MSFSSLDTMTILRGLLKAGEHLIPGSSGGSHTEVFKLRKDILEKHLAEWIRISGRNPSRRKKQIADFSEELSSKYLLKRGNIDYFIMRLGGKEEAVIRRSDVSEVFGKVGYNLHPSFEKTVQDATEACREIPYFSFGPPSEQFAPSIVDSVKSFVTGRIRHLPPGDEEAVFLINEVESRRELTTYEILTEDAYFKNRLSNFTELDNLQKSIRANPIDRAVEERLRNFFSAPITVGIRDTMRWFLGSRHPRMGWEDAREVIEDCFRKHGDENFLLPEINVYAPSTDYEGEEFEEINKTNAEISEIFFRDVNKNLPLSISGKIGGRLLRHISEQVLSFHHDYPVYDVEPVSGYLNNTTTRLMARLVSGFIFHMLRAGFPDRTNIDVSAALYRRGLLESLRTVLSENELETTLKVLQTQLFNYMLRGGVKVEDGSACSYRRINTTFYCFQGRADYIPPGERLLHKVSLEDLSKPEHAYLLREFPELAEKLVVFFVMVVRFYLDTDFIPDLRPDEAGINIFVLGIWGSITENVIILITEDENRNERIQIKFVDNKDHFKAYRREVDRDRPLGLAKHALRMVGPVVEPAMLRAIGQFVQTTWENRTGFKPPPKDPVASIERLLDIFGEVVLQSMDETQAHVRTVVEDGLDDTSRAVAALVRKTLRKSAPPEPKGPFI